MGKEACCKIMPAFHTLTGCDYTAPIFGQSKYNIFKNMQNIQMPKGCYQV